MWNERYFSCKIYVIHINCFWWEWAEWTNSEVVNSLIMSPQQQSNLRTAPVWTDIGSGEGNPKSSREWANKARLISAGRKATTWMTIPSQLQLLHLPISEIIFGAKGFNLKPFRYVFSGLILQLQMDITKVSSFSNLLLWLRLVLCPSFHLSSSKPKGRKKEMKWNLVSVSRISDFFPE